MFQDKHGRGTEIRTLIDRLKAGYSTFELYPDCFSFFLKALLLLRCEPAFRFITTIANGLRCLLAFILQLLLKNFGLRGRI